LKRREFITVVGGAAVWPITARAQKTAMPVVGYLTLFSSAAAVPSVAAFRQGLNDTGFVEGQNVAIEYRYASAQYDRIPALAADLVRRKPVAIYAAGPPSVRALRAQTALLPIVFTMGEDPVKEGLVASFNRPDDNITGVSFFTNLLFPKRLQLLNEIVPRPASLALIVNPNNPNAEPDAQDARAASVALGREMLVLMASTERGIEEAFLTLVQQRVGGLIVGVDALFRDRRDQIIALATRHAIPTIYEQREYPEAGGLMSYGVNYPEQLRQCGIYIGRILKGEKPSSLPVLQPTKFDFVINLRIAKVLGLSIPPGLLAIADDVIE
jgi:ABC-type uncharacterized transport system substrate-binding protein